MILCMTRPFFVTSRLVSARRTDSRSLRLSWSSSHEQSKTLTHLDEKGKARMVDVTDKLPTSRTALAIGRISLGEGPFRLLKEHSGKGDALTVSQLAGIMGAKRTSELIPLCHPLNLTSIKVDLTLNEADFSVDIQCLVKCHGTTGVEMEALTGVSVTALTVYDMCKAASKDMVIQNIRLVKKTGGKSDYQASR